MTTDDTVEADVDNEAILAERDALMAEVQELRERRRAGSRFRRLVVVVGVFLSCLLVVGAVLGVWARRSFLETEVFTERAGGLVDEPEVQGALGGYLAAEVNSLIDAQGLIQETLPESASVLSGPLAVAVEGFVQDRVNEFVASDTFADLWKGAVELAHGEAVAVLEGRNPVIESGSESVTINLLPVVNQILVEVTSASPELFGKPVSLPDVTVQDVPEEARAAIEEATGVTLDENFGTFTIYDEGALSAAQDGLVLINTLVYALVVLAVVGVAVTIWLSRHRRRTILQLSAGVTIGMVLIRRITFVFQDDLLEVVARDPARGAVRVTSETFIAPLQNGAYWLGVIALVVAAVAAVTGPYEWAVRLRAWASSTGRTVVGAVSDQAQDEATAAWVARNEDALRAGGAVAGLLGLFFVDLSWLGFFGLLGLVGLFVLAVTRIAEQCPDREDGSPAAADASA